MSYQLQNKLLSKPVDILIATPGRLLDLHKQRKVKINDTEIMVLDEADEMLNMGFKDELDKVLEATPETKQTLLFSATFPKEVEAIARNYMTKPIEVTSGQKNSGTAVSYTHLTLPTKRIV